MNVMGNTTSLLQFLLLVMTGIHQFVDSQAPFPSWISVIPLTQRQTLVQFIEQEQQFTVEVG